MPIFMVTIYRCDVCGIEVQDTDRSAADGWEEDVEGDAFCPKCWAKRAALDGDDAARDGDG